MSKIKTFKEFIKESVWADLHSRGIGELEREEDEYNPEYIDFGKDTSVYWAVENLEIDGKNKFYFREVKDYNNNGWRLPSVEEVKELAWNVNISWDGSTHIKFQDGNELRIHSDTMYGFHMWTKDINKKFKNNIWVYGFDNFYKFAIDSYNTSINKCFVFLVKDKKKQ